MKHLLALICFSFTFITVFSQKKGCDRFIPFYKTYNTKKLADRITKGLEDDSSKVVAIHCWITHHIKYDVKKFLAFDYRKVPVKKILRKRKAICTGCSDLFNELCKHSKITSISVPGYVKNLDTDLHDTFYVEEHVWNAVYIHNEWKLIDACWDAGYIKYTKKTLIHHALFYLTLGRLNIYIIKPHFKFYTTDNYLLKNGSQFNYDHLPLDPIWQLTDSIVSIKEFENDSSFYFSNCNDSDNNSYCTKFEGQRMNYNSMTEYEKYIYIGPVSHKFNPLNHFPLAYSKLLIANDLFENIDKKSEDTLTVLNQCDSVLNKTDTAIFHFDSSLFYFVKEKGELEIKNKIKNETLKSQNRELLASTIKAKSRLMTVKKSSKRAKTNLKSIQKNNSSKVKKLNQNKKIEKAKPLKNFEKSEVEKLFSIAESLNDSVAIINTTIRNQFAFIDSLYNVNSLYLSEYSFQSRSNLNKTGLLISIRLAYFDDLDYEIRSVKDSILEYKFANDSLLLDADNVFIIKSYFSEIRKLKKQLNALYRYRKSLGNIYVKLKKHHVSEADELYQRNLNAYQSEIYNYNQKLNQVKSRIIYFKKQCKQIVKKVTKHELKKYKEEARVEKVMHTHRKKYINKRHRSLTKNTKNQIKECNKIKNKTKSIENKYKRVV